jgi:hypothetical protein
MSVDGQQFSIEGRPPIVVRNGRIYWAGDFWDPHGGDSIEEFCDQLTKADQYARSHPPVERGDAA